jgi:erythromycin esterase
MNKALNYFVRKNVIEKYSAMKHLCFYIFFICLSITVLFGQSPGKIVPILKNFTHPLPQSEAHDALKSLESISHYWDHSQVLGLGEATHGTHDFFSWKGQIIRYAVSHQHFRLVAFEAPFDLVKANEYVVYGKGNPHTALSSLAYHIWRTHEVLELLVWLHDFNKKQPKDDRVHVVGFDIPNPSRTNYFGSFWADTTLWESPGFEAAKACLANYRSENTKPLFTWLTNNKTLLVQEYGGVVYRNMLQYAHVFGQYTTLFGLADRESTLASSNFRDSCMAANMLWLYNHAFPKKKCILWAHNGHITTQLTTKVKFPKIPIPMGEYLRHQFGKAYYILGMGFGEGQFRAQSTQEDLAQVFTASAPKKRSLGEYLYMLEGPALFLDWNALRQRPELAQWLNKKLTHRIVGAGYDPKNENHYYTMERRIGKYYDGWLFVKKTTAAKDILHPSIYIALDTSDVLEDRLAMEMYIKTDSQSTIPPCKPWVSMLCWTQNAEIARYNAKTVFDPARAWWHLTIEGDIPQETQILKVSVSCKCHPSMFLDDMIIKADGRRVMQKSFETANVDQELVQAHRGTTVKHSAEESFGGKQSLKIALSNQ